MQDDLRGGAHYKLIPLVENLEEAVKFIYQLQSLDEEEIDKYQLE